MYICHPFIIHSSDDCYLAVLCLAGESSVAVKLGMQVSPWMLNSFPLGISLKEGYLDHIYGRSAFSFSEKPLTALHNGYADLHSKPWSLRVLPHLSILPDLVSFAFLIIAILTGVGWYLIVDLSCIKYFYC